MSATSPESVLARFQAQRLIPVFYHADRATALAAVEACYEGGLTVFEYANRGPDALANFQFLTSETRHVPGLYLGIGTILNLRDAQPFLEAGAGFVVSPALVPEMAAIRTAGDCLWIPGCATLSEVAHARALGATMIKLYPAAQIGPAFVRAVKAVLPDSLLMPTGGISIGTNELEQWFHAGAVCVGLGSQLFPAGLGQPTQRQQLVQRIKQLVEWTGTLP